MNKLVRTLAVSLLVLGSSPCFAGPPTDAELDDWFVYLKSVGAPATVELCSPFVADKAKLASDTQHWLQANTDAIARGKVVAVSGLAEKWKSIDEFNAAMLGDFKLKFTALADTEKAEACSKWQEGYQLPADK